MEVLDTTIANVALPYIAGGMGVSEDEASWVVTTYLVANAVILTASSYLAKRFGRKSFFLICLGCSPSARCCAAWRGISIRAAAVPHPARLRGRRHGARSRNRSWRTPFRRKSAARPFALFGIAVVVAPVVGPTLGGWLPTTCPGAGAS
jgi:DHA2 family multidrug resistance protein